LRLILEIGYKLVGRFLRRLESFSEAEAAMGAEELVEELATVEFEAGYEFENGKPFYETLGRGRAKGLLKALETRGLVLVPSNLAPLSISEAGSREGGASKGASIRT
jgi:hypothetical protein